MSQMLKSSGAMAIATMTSRVLGMVREIVYAWFMGAGVVAGAFVLAFQIPNLFRRLLGEGALTAAFIPIFKEKERTSSPAEMWRAANAVISGLLAVASVITLIVIAGISIFLASGYFKERTLPPFDDKSLVDVRSLASIMSRHDGPLSQYMWDHFSEPLRVQLANASNNAGSLGAAMKQQDLLRTNLLIELNSLIASGPIYDPTRFKDVPLPASTRQLLQKNPQGAELAGLNRLLLEEAFPQQLTDNQREKGLMFRLLRVMFPYMLLICLTAVFMGILNARGHFFIPASGALVMNTVMIASVFFLAPHMGKTLNEKIFALAIGVLVAGTAQALLQLPWLRAEGFRYRWVTPWNDPTVARVVRQMIPGTIGVAAFQINMLVNQSVAYYCVDPSIVAWFNYSVRLMELPQGVFGISLATYLLPTLAGLAADRKLDEFRGTLNNGVDHLVYANLPASIFLCVLSVPIMRLLFEHGRFTQIDSLQAGAALAYLAPGLVAFSLVNIFARAFYALGDTKTPMKISIGCLILNLVLTVALIFPLRQRGMGLANTASALCNVCLLYIALKKKLGHLELTALKHHTLQLLGAGLVAGVVVWGVGRWWTVAIGHAGFWRRLGEVFVPMMVAGGVYFIVTVAMRLPAATEIGRLAWQRVRGR